MFDKDLGRVQGPKGASEGTQYVVPVWWLEKYTTEIVVEANSPDEAAEKVEGMIDSGQIVLANNGKTGELYDWNTAGAPLKLAGVLT